MHQSRNKLIEGAAEPVFVLHHLHTTTENKNLGI